MFRQKKIILMLMATMMLNSMTGCGSRDADRESVLPTAEEEMMEQESDWVEEWVFQPSYTKNFFDRDETNMPVEVDNGIFYGWQDRIWTENSTWLSVAEFTQGASASSTLEDQGAFSYGVENIYNERRTNTWAEGVEGDGIGEYVEITQACVVGSKEEKHKLTFTELCIVNGYAATEEKWKANGRVKKLKMYYEGEYVGMIELEDTMYPQYIDISALDLSVENGEEAAFRFEIADVYKGDTHEDTCITGILIEFAGRKAQ